MKKYEFLEHTADAKFRAYGKGFGDAFENAALAMASVMYDSKSIASKKKESISAEGNDMKQLLYSFLEEFLVLMDSKGFLLSKFSKKPVISEKEGRFKITAEVLGDTASENYEVSPSVKAITYNEMEISEKPLYVQVVVDT